MRYQNSQIQKTESRIEVMKGKGGVGELLFNRYRISAEDEKVLEMDSSNGCTTT